MNRVVNYILMRKITQLFLGKQEVAVEDVFIVMFFIFIAVLIMVGCAFLYRKKRNLKIDVNRHRNF